MSLLLAKKKHYKKHQILSKYTEYTGRVWLRRIQKS